MSIHYHGTPITPRSVLYTLHGKHFCVSYADARDAQVCHEIGQSVMLDNGAFTYWRIGRKTEWDAAYQEWVMRWTEYRTTWAVLPDVIDGWESDNDALIDVLLSRFRSRKNQLSPVWHVHESLERLYRLMGQFDRVCFGSSGEYAQLNTPKWNNRMNDVFNRICKGSGRPPVWIHMLRGMSLSGSIYPFASVDSTDVARNHEQVAGRARTMADKWDALQCPATWKVQPVQMEELIVSPAALA